MLIVSLFCGLAAGSCVMSQPAEPLLATVRSSYVCGRVQFTITSPTAVTPDWPDLPCNGNPPLAIIDAGVMGWDEASGRTLTMPLRIVNRGTEPVQLPIRLILPVNGKTVLNPFETPNSTMVPLNADSTRTDGTKVWLVGGSGTVAPSDSTTVTTVLFQINSPVIQGRFAFTISGETEDQFPAAPPDSTPTWFAHDSSWSSRRILKGVAVVDFIQGTTVTTRKAAIDSVGGTVIGGYHLTGDSVGTYFVKIPSAVTDSLLIAALQKLMRQPGVRSATLRSLPSPTGSGEPPLVPTRGLLRVSNINVPGS